MGKESSQSTFLASFLSFVPLCAAQNPHHIWPPSQLHKMHSLRRTQSQPHSDSAVERYAQLLDYVSKEGALYLDSSPGSDLNLKNSGLHTKLRRILNEDYRPDIRLLESLRRQIDYRMLHVIRLATTYKNLLGVDFPDCLEMSLQGMRLGDGSKLILEYPLFDPDLIQGPEYNKGRFYLAACIDSAGWSRQGIIQRLDGLMRYKGESTLQSVIFQQLTSS